MAAEKGNNYAKKDNPKSCLVNLRMRPIQRSKVAAHAESIGLTTSAYIMRLIEADMGKLE